MVISTSKYETGEQLSPEEINSDSMKNLNTKIGLEIHVQLKTKSKMFCRCDNQSFAEATDGKQCIAIKPNTLVCPVCLGLPGALPVANEQAILWTIKTGLALNCEIPKIAKFDRKHYFYPDLPKGYQISQYDEPFCLGGYVDLNNAVIPDLIGNLKNEELDPRVPTSQMLRGASKPEDDNHCRIRLNRIHLEEDAGKLIHKDGKSLVDLNRAGTPLMEIVTEPDITTPKMAGDFLRKLQKIVRDQVEVSMADMEKGHLRCDANISVNDGSRMSPIIEIKNINSFKFVEKALALVEEKLKVEYGEWPEKNSKETWGYDSVDNKVYLQRRKEEAADYRYFPEPDLPPFKTEEFDIAGLKDSIVESAEERISILVSAGIAESDAKVLVSNRSKGIAFEKLNDYLASETIPLAAKALVNNYFGFELVDQDLEKLPEYAKLIEDFAQGKFAKNILADLAKKIHDGEVYALITKNIVTKETVDFDSVIEKILENSKTELSRYRAGEKQLFGFFMGQAMKEIGSSANPQEISRILKEKLEQR